MAGGRGKRKKAFTFSKYHQELSELNMLGNAPHFVKFETVTEQEYTGSNSKKNEPMRDIKEVLEEVTTKAPDSPKVELKIDIPEDDFLDLSSEPSTESTLSPESDNEKQAQRPLVRSQKMNFGSGFFGSGFINFFNYTTKKDEKEEQQKSLDDVNTTKTWEQRINKNSKQELGR